MTRSASQETVGTPAGNRLSAPGDRGTPELAGGMTATLHRTRPS